MSPHSRASRRAEASSPWPVQPGREGTRRRGRAFPAYNFALPAIGQKVGPVLIAVAPSSSRSPNPTPLPRSWLRRSRGDRSPAGVLNIVAARAPESEYLVRHPGVDMVSFTGSVEVGARIAAACGELIRPCVLELGGKSAAIVLEDAKTEDVLPASSAPASAPTRPELRRPDPAAGSGVPVPRLRRGPGRRIRLPQDR
ncbi:aldehyde dehydrogenase family protein [Streptomyces sp. F001]|nr:aldehyde dehydrogenase family protein [Streptomyces sp. F001]